MANHVVYFYMALMFIVSSFVFGIAFSTLRSNRNIWQVKRTSKRT